MDTGVIVGLVGGALVVMGAAGRRAKARRGPSRGGKLKGLRALATIYATGLGAMVRRKRTTPAAEAAARRRELAKVAVRAGMTVMRARVKGRFVGAERRARLRDAAGERASRDVVATMAEMRGLAMKMGQMGSYIMNVSAPAERELVKLQADVPGVPASVIISVLEAEFGPDVMERFAEFSEQPLAAASIGQVHAARLRDGREVVVKVQYPGVRETVLADLENLDLLYSIMSLSGGSADLGAVVQNLGQTMREEIDYAREADNQAYFADRYRGHRWVKIPEVVRELSTDCVLTSERVHGRRFYEILELPEAERNHYAEVIYRFAFGSVLDGVFSGDPHPGNYLFLDEGRVCFLDFGFVGRLSPEDAAVVAAPIQAALRDDRQALAAGLQGIGLLPPGPKVAPEKAWTETEPLLIGPIGADDVVRLDPDDFAAAFKRTQKMTSEMNKASRKVEYMPPWITVVMRYTLGTLAVLARLRAANNWRRLAADIFLDEPADTEVAREWPSEPRRARRARRPGEQLAPAGEG